jgi:uncharacterized OB-fold protein
MSDEPTVLQAIHQLGGSPDDLPFWNASSEGRFCLHRCGVCGKHYWPASRCVEHADQDMAWVDASGRGTVHTFSVLHHAYTPEMHGKTPYVVAVVQLDEGPFFHTNIVGCSPADVAIDMRVNALFEARANGLTVPLFQPVSAGDASKLL